MCCFDEQACLRRFESVMEILTEYFELRLNVYQDRKKFLEGMLEAEAEKLNNQARFIKEKCSGELVVENKKRKTIIEELLRRGYKADPVKQWKAAIGEEEDDEVPDEDQEVDEEEVASSSSSKKNLTTASGLDNDNIVYILFITLCFPEKAISDVQKFDYLLGMSMWMLTEERKNELLMQRDAKMHELKILKKKTNKDLWREDLDALLDKLDQVETKERLAEEDAKPAKKGLAVRELFI